MARSTIKMNAGWAKQVLLHQAAEAGVEARAEAIAGNVGAQGYVAHSGQVVQGKALPGTQERTRARAIVVIDHPGAAAIEAAHGLLNRAR